MNASLLKNFSHVFFQGVGEYADNGNLSAKSALQGEETLPSSSTHWSSNKWLVALRQVLPLYVAIHVAAFITTCLSVLYLQHDFAAAGHPLSVLWQAWHHWDTGNYISIAMHGYGTINRTVFFPLYPILIHIFAFIYQPDPIIAELLISSVTNLVWMVVLYQLVLEDFGHDCAQRTVLYLSIFPFAFFFLAGYTESLFLCLALLSFYHARHGHWWLSGLSGFFACLTRSTGIILLLPFCYEYLRQHQFQIRKFGFGIVAGGLILVSIGLYAFYCWKTFGDPLSFSHQEISWQRHLMPPWSGIIKAVRIIKNSNGLLSFYALRNLTDLLPDLLILFLLILGCAGPWRFKKEQWSYLLYGIPLYLIIALYPRGGGGEMPLESVGRYMLEIFPAFILLALLGKFRWLHISYISIASSTCYFLLTQFLTGHWVL
jgi:Gpi18-like mannosyltransferase